jgi:hypothetical protein
MPRPATALLYDPVARASAWACSVAHLQRQTLLACHPDRVRVRDQTLVPDGVFQPS